jgi:glycosyltransferase involved in cell wall biosynthesis
MENKLTALDQPHVSVVMPLYNKEHYVLRAVNSVLSQSYPRFEILIVDDGSTDSGPDIVRGITDPRIRLFTQPNRGKCTARNHALSMASADLIAFLDADDEWMPDFLETVINLRSSFPEAAVWGTAYYEITPDGTKRCIPMSDTLKRQTGGLIINFFRFSLQYQQPCNASSTMVAKDALVKAGGFPDCLARLGDTDTLFRLALRYPVAYCPVEKAIYHMEAVNRSDAYLYSGNYLFFKHARTFLKENRPVLTLDEDVLQYLGYYHTRGLYRNWITRNREAMREIIRDCSGIKGYRKTCFFWRLLAGIPRPLVKVFVRMRYVVARCLGRSGMMPPVRSIFRDEYLENRVFQQKER